MANTMPLNLVLVRHGESEGNVAGHRSKAGDHSAFTEAYRLRHSSKWRLTERGIWQAKDAGLWLRREGLVEFDRYYTSTYLRAMETAAYLDLAGADWRMLDLLREREWGALDTLDNEERWTMYERNLNRRQVDRYYWRTPEGESMADMVFIRMTILLNQLARECAGKQAVIIVCHGEVIKALLTRFRYLSPEQFNTWDLSKDPKDDIHNGQIIHLTRLDPNTGELADRLAWWRSVWPSDASLSYNSWEYIAKPRITNRDLLTMAGKYPRLVNDD